MYALVDAVSFYASAEKVFDPSIRNKPVVVLTNNDGYICAVCPIARKLGALGGPVGIEYGSQDCEYE
jgi:DNA polymerase V